MVRKYPGVFLLAFIISGIVLADQSEARSWVFLLSTVVGSAGGLVAVARQQPRRAVFLLALAIGSFGGFHFAHDYYDTGPHHLKNVVTEVGAYRVYGRVADWPDLKADRTEIEIEVDSLEREGVRRVSGAIMLKVTGVTTELQRGDRVEFYGRIYPVKEDRVAVGFDYNRYLRLVSEAEVGVWRGVYADVAGCEGRPEEPDRSGSCNRPGSAGDQRQFPAESGAEAGGVGQRFFDRGDAGHSGVDLPHVS
jgi:hypothetical protein